MFKYAKYILKAKQFDTSLFLFSDCLKSSVSESGLTIYNTQAITNFG